MFRFKRLISSLSFRINITLFIILGILGGTFVKGLTYVVKRVNNGYNCVMITRRISRAVDEQMLHMESAIKAGAFASQTKKLTEGNSRTFCDSIRSLVNADTVYIMSRNGANDIISKKAQEVWTTNNTLWTEPYLTHGNITHMTLLTPLSNKKGVTYAILCAEISMKWLKEIVRRESISERTAVNILSRENKYIFSSDSTLATLRADSSVRMKLDQVNIIDSKFGFNLSDQGSTSTVDIERLGWTTRVETPVDDYDAITIIVMIMTYTMMTLLFLSMALCIILTLRLYLHPLRTIADATEEISHGNFDVTLPKIKQHTDIRQLRDSFVKMQQALKQYIQDLRYTTEQKVSIERDISIAATIQQGMLPNEIGEREDIDVCGILRPAKTIGGDIYDYFIRKVTDKTTGQRDEYLFFCIGDVSGKGVPAALLMTVTGHLFRNISRRTTNVAKICSSINIDLAEGNNENMFCTTFVGVLNLTTGLLNYCNAGHNAPIILHDGKAEFLNVTTNLPFGIEPDMKYQVETLHLNKGDILFLYTDGVTEAENLQKELFGNEATIKALSAASNSSNMKTLIANVTAAVNNFADGAEQSDDMTILAIKIKCDYQHTEVIARNT